MNTMETLFVQYFMTDLNAINAAASLIINHNAKGTEEEVALDYMSREVVQDALAKRLTLVPSKSNLNLAPADYGITEGYILVRLKRISEVAKYSEQLKALELMGKHIGMWKESKQDSTTLNIFDEGIRANLIKRIKEANKPKDNED